MITVLLFVFGGIGIWLFLWTHPKPQPRNIFEINESPSPHQEILQLTAKSEHELGWVPHGDRDVLRACKACHYGFVAPDMSLEGPEA